MFTATAKRTGRINHSGLTKPENTQTKLWLFETTSQLFISNKPQQISQQFLPMHLANQSIQAGIGNEFATPTSPRMGEEVSEMRK